MNETDKKLESLKKKCKVASVVLLVFKIVLIIAIVLVALGISITTINADEINAEVAGNEAIAHELTENINVSIDASFGILSINMSDFVAEGKIAEAMILICASIILMMVLLFIIVSIFKSIFDVLAKGESPFTANVIKKLKKAFIFFTIGTLTISIGVGIMVGLFLWCIYGIFQYGGELQKQSDETL